MDVIIVNRCKQSDEFRTVLPAKMCARVLVLLMLAAAAVLVVGAAPGAAATTLYAEEGWSVHAVNECVNPFYDGDVMLSPLVSSVCSPDNDAPLSVAEVYSSSSKIAFYSDYMSISDTSSDGLSAYADALRAQGYTVEQIYDPITSSELDDCEALLMIGLGSYLSSSEKSAIEDFVENQNKGLLISGGSRSAVNDLAQNFTGGSMEWFGSNIVCDPTDYEVYPKWVKIQTFYDHPITENLGRIIMYKGTNIPAAWAFGGIIGCAYSDEDSWLDEDGDYVCDAGESRGAQPVLAYSSWDKIVIVPDGNVFDNSDADEDGVVAFYECDNGVLGLNVARWLAVDGGEIDYKFDEYGVLQQAYDEEYATNKASPTRAVVLEPYIDLIPYDSGSIGATLDQVSIEISNGWVTIYDPVTNTLISADGSLLTWNDSLISDEYFAELFYEADFVHPLELTASITVSGTEVSANVQNIVNYPIYDIVVLYPQDSSWRYVIVGTLGIGQQTNVSLSDPLPAEIVNTVLHNHFIPGLNSAGLDATQHRDDWIDSWIRAWLAQDTPSTERSAIVYRIPETLYEQYFSCSVTPQPTRGMARVGMVELFDLPDGSKRVHNVDTGKDFSTIQDAINDPITGYGDTITVDPGTYPENVNVYKSLTIKSTSGNPGDTIVQAAVLNQNVCTITADNVEISGLTIEGASDWSGGWPAGILLDGACGCIITKNIISNNVENIILDQSSGNTITKNTISDSLDHSLSSWSGNDNNIYLNNFKDNTHLPSTVNVTWNSISRISYKYHGNAYVNYLGNYWDDYDGSDADGDGIGETPYNMCGDDDNHPLVEPFENYILSCEDPIARYDANGNGYIDRDELKTVIYDYLKPPIGTLISRDDLKTLIYDYLAHL